MDKLARSSLDADTKLWQGLQKILDSSPENVAKSKVQLSRDGNSIICTRRNSALAQFIARVFTKLLPVDFYDKFCIANPGRQENAVKKFHGILSNRFDFIPNESSFAKSMSLNELGVLLQECGVKPQDSGANNVLRKIFSISNVEKNKIASGDFRKDLKKFGGININEISDSRKESLKQIYDQFESLVQGMEAYEFSADERGYILASIIEETKPALLSDPKTLSEKVFGTSLNLARFIHIYSENLGNDGSYEIDVIKKTADDALKVMKRFAELSDLVRGTELGKDQQPGFAKTAMLPLLHYIADKKTTIATLRHFASSHIAAGGGTAFAVLEKISLQESNARNPQLARCASFEPILAVLNMQGFMGSANNSYNDNEKNGKINSADLQAAWNSVATEFIQNAHHTTD